MTLFAFIAGIMAGVVICWLTNKAYSIVGVRVTLKHRRGTLYQSLPAQISLGENRCLDSIAAN